MGEIWEELLITLKLLCSTYLKIKGICLLKALKFKRLKYTAENTASPFISPWYGMGECVVKFHWTPEGRSVIFYQFTLQLPSCYQHHFITD